MIAKNDLRTPEQIVRDWQRNGEKSLTLRMLNYLKRVRQHLQREHDKKCALYSAMYRDDESERKQAERKQRELDIASQELEIRQKAAEIKTLFAEINGQIEEAELAERDKKEIRKAALDRVKKSSR
jgi:Skp family chaperone for outer membrane proteins